MNFPDLRGQLTAAQQWVQGLIAAVGPEHLDRPTPCSDYDVRSLIGHLYGGAERARRMAVGADAGQVPVVLELPDGGLADGYGDSISASQAAWDQRSDLSEPVIAPWGEVPAAGAVGGCLVEVLTHGWDLATATGQSSEADPELAGPALVAARTAIPADSRGGSMPFAPVVEPAPDSTPTEQLANWMGRTTR